MSDTSANLALPYLQPAQAQKHVTVNEALTRLDALVQPVVLDRDRAEPPEAPAAGDRYIVAEGTTGAWQGQTGGIALWDGTAWQIFPPGPGWQVRCLAEAATLVWSGSAWGVAGETLAGIAELGVNASLEAVNRLAVAAPGVLFSHEGADHRVTVNKAAASDTASLLFQTGWSGRIELGTAGDDDFAVKVSADGAAWTEALRLDTATGHASGAAVQAGAGDATAGRLMKVGAFGLGGNGRNPSGLYSDLGDVSQLLSDGITSTPSDKPAAGRAHAGFHVSASADRWLQMLAQVAGGSGAGDLKFRVNYNGMVSDWLDIYNERNILGPVSQSGGVPNGAVIERGSNANGEYVKFADGTLICTHRVSSSASEEVVWTYPASFGGNLGDVDTAVASVDSSSGAHFASIGRQSVHANVNAWNTSGSRVAVNVNVMAVGRWF